jgi:hypothetical protein
MDEGRWMREDGRGKMWLDGRWKRDEGGRNSEIILENY